MYALHVLLYLFQLLPCCMLTTDLLLLLQAEGITVWDAGALGKSYSESAAAKGMAGTLLVLTPLLLPLFAVQLSSVDFHKLRSLLEDFGQRSAVAQVSTPSQTTGLDHGQPNMPYHIWIHKQAGRCQQGAVETHYTPLNLEGCHSKCVFAVCLCCLCAGPESSHHRHMEAAQLRPAPVHADSRCAHRLLCRAGGPQGRQEEALHAQGEQTQPACTCQHSSRTSHFW